jgi:hypothetical protein
MWPVVGKTLGLGEGGIDVESVTAAEDVDKEGVTDSGIDTEAELD